MAAKRKPPKNDPALTKDKEFMRLRHEMKVADAKACGHPFERGLRIGSPWCIRNGARVEANPKMLAMARRFIREVRAEGGHNS